MRYKMLALFMGIIVAATLQAQAPEKKRLRIVDTLSNREQAERNPIILRSELDSMIKQWNEAHPTVPVQQPVKESSTGLSNYMLTGLVVIVFLLSILLLLFFRHQKRINRTFAGLGTKASADTIASSRNGKVKPGIQVLEKKITELDAELHKLSKENEGLNKVVQEYNGIQHEYDSMKHILAKAYKIKNYPGYDKTKGETSLLQGVLDTETAVANYAYEKFLKPLFVLIDANKNNPAKVSSAHKEKMLDLLVSLSLLYIEYLYLRVSDLSIGGKMVERIQGFSKGNGLDPTLLKKLDTEFGSRALVIRMVLDNGQLRDLSYPVFDETNLNPQ